jgi:hypothetical protein
VFSHNWFNSVLFGFYCDKVAFNSFLTDWAADLTDFLEESARRGDGRGGRVVAAAEVEGANGVNSEPISKL